MGEEDEQRDVFSRRSVLTHLAAITSGWFIGTFLDPLRRTVNRVIADTYFGRRARVSFGYSPTPDTDEDGYLLHIGNSGQETAENVSAHIAFEEQITDYEVIDQINTPPAPNTQIEITDGGVAKIHIDSVRRDVYEHFNIIRIYFTIDTSTQSDLAFKIEEDDGMFVAYQYSWTFLGERYYDSTDHHIARKD